MTTYSISLDDVDLALLPVRSRHYNDFLKKEHYEFRLMASDGMASEPQLYTCHTCAIEVPSAYTREHSASAKHRANARIAAAAAQRMRALVSSPPPPLTPHHAGRFCESCSMTVSGDHEKTKEHRIAVIHDRMLIDLMKVYVGLDEDIEEAKNGNDCNRTVISDASEANTKVGNDVVVANVGADDSIVNSVSITESDQEVSAVADSEVQSIQEDIPNGPDTNSYVKIDTGTYINLLKSYSEEPRNTLKAAGDQVQIILKNETVKVSTDNFHSFYRVKGKIQCRVCCETMNLANEEAHKLSKTHMERVSKFVSDSHCLREIYGDWSHCIICNHVIKTSTMDAHKQTKFHFDRKRNACQKTDNNLITESFIQQRPRTSGLCYKNNTKYKSTSQINTVDDKVELPYKTTRNPMNVFCTVCECEVPMKLSNRLDHLKGFRHATSLKNAQKNVKNDV